MPTLNQATVRGETHRGTETRGKGFTMVEILVVVAIISILAGLITVSVQHARGFADIKMTRTEIQHLVAAAEGFKNGFGDYPPTYFSHPTLGLKTNGINEGNESLIAHLATRRFGGPFEANFSDDRLENLDNDKLSAADLNKIRKALDWTRGKPDLLEYCDRWGNPFVYIHHRDYRSAKNILYVDSEGKSITVKASLSQKTGAYQGPTSFQIWSFGPNRINENGEGDDIVSWRE